MFITALFPIARLWKPPQCSSVGEWIKKVCYIYQHTSFYCTYLYCTSQMSLFFPNEDKNIHQQKRLQLAVLLYSLYCGVWHRTQSLRCMPVHSALLFSMRKDILPLATTWMGLQHIMHIMLSKISQRKTNTVLRHLYGEPKKVTPLKK